jgi:4'-phosphopantetheinyl transferase
LNIDIGHQKNGAQRFAMGLAGSLQFDDAHVWQMNLGNPIWDGFSTVLNDAEREQAARFRSPKLQQRFSRCRSALRLILGKYVDQAAVDLIFQYGQFGKPELRDHRLQFNLSHSGDHALVAVSAHELGVDLEFTGKDKIDLDGLIDMVCHPTERAALNVLGEAEKSAQFYRLWTQKEAYCKMSGMGLQQSLPALHFNATANDAVRQVCADDAPTPHFVHNLQAPDGYAASLCVPLATARIAFFTA